MEKVFRNQPALSKAASFKRFISVGFVINVDDICLNLSQRRAILKWIRGNDSLSRPGKNCKLSIKAYQYVPLLLLTVQLQIIDDCITSGFIEEGHLPETDTKIWGKTKDTSETGDGVKLQTESVTDQKKVQHYNNIKE